MRIKLDENLPTRLVSMLAELGHDVDTVPSAPRPMPEPCRTCK